MEKINYDYYTRGWRTFSQKDINGTEEERYRVNKINEFKGRMLKSVNTDGDNSLCGCL